MNCLINILTDQIINFVTACRLTGPISLHLADGDVDGAEQVVSGGHEGKVGAAQQS